MMIRFAHHQVIGFRLEVMVASGRLSPITYNLLPQATEGSA